MDWTPERRLQELLAAPWTVTPAEPSAHGDYVVARVVELPGTMATASNERELARELYDSIFATLECLLDAGDPIPLPAGYVPAWLRPDSAEAPTLRPSTVRARATGNWDVIANANAQTRNVVAAR